MSNIFQIFGSKSSEDYNVMIFVDKIPQTDEAKQLCEKWNKKLYFTFLDTSMPIKKINCNLAVLKDGIIVEVFKGISDEINNSLYLTYNLHKQFHEQQITKLVDRDVDIKIMRSARFMLMNLSYTQHRFEVKKALKGNFVEKIKVLDIIDLSKIDDLGQNVGLKWVDYLKSMSFQIGQSLALTDGVEVYSKEEIADRYPDLSEMLFKTGQNLTILEEYKEEFVRRCKLHIRSMKTFDEYKK
ncbi:MAG: hypothetical protein HPY57_15310 [Ignavibacteria bacterium]|nr:hypothetical protein [Ignavibacteria bacterium]